jgi:23S rRNA (pseudouridine1915-N3)-methyltransferase
LKLLVVAVGQRMPAWVDAGFDAYAKRMPREAQLSLIEIKPEPRGEASRDGSRDAERLAAAEGKRILAALPKDAFRIVLDERGKLCTTAALAERYAIWRMAGRHIAFIIGGPDGLASAIKQDADFVWSLTPLTLPHALVRVVVAEQLYRAHTIFEGHPYHRA